jgi:aspartate/methionine/tyrosine aminotransferase
VQLSTAAIDVRPSKIREIFALAQEYPGTLMLLAGEDTRPTPDFIKHAAQAAIAANKTFYTPIAGYPEVRAAIAAHLERLHGATVDPAREILVTASGMNAIVLACQATIGPGRSALIVTPCWPNLAEAARVTGADVIESPLALVGRHYQLDWERLERDIRPDTHLIALASPGNPTGWMATSADWTRLAELAERRQAWLLADAAYDRIVFDDRVAPSPLTLPHASPFTIHAYTFSKSYRMTGWRLGYIVAPATITERMMQLQEFVVSHAPGFVQEAGRVALENGEPSIADDQRRYDRHRTIALESLDRLEGVATPSPAGAFYLFPRFERLRDTTAFCNHLVREYRLGLAPGAAFGSGGDGHIRICFAVEEHVLRDALERLTHAWTVDRERFTK